MDVDVGDSVARCRLLRKPDVLFASLKALDVARGNNSNDCRYSEPPPTTTTLSQGLTVSHKHATSAAS